MLPSAQSEYRPLYLPSKILCVNPTLVIERSKTAIAQRAVGRKDASRSRAYWGERYLLVTEVTMNVR